MKKSSEQEVIKPLTLEVTIKYLKRHAWTTHEAVLMLNLIDPSSPPFYDDEDVVFTNMNVNTYLFAAYRFNPKHKLTSVKQWLEWAVRGTKDEQRHVPLSFATQFLKYVELGDPESLRGLSEAMDQELNELSSARSKQVCAALQQGHKKKATDQQVRTAHKRITKDKVSKAQAAREINISPNALKKRFKTLDLPIPKR